MRIPATHRRTSVGANMTPMIDVVFLLIIFFLVSSHLAQQETKLPVELPVANSALPDTLEIAPLTIHVDAQSRWYLGARVVDLATISSAISTYRQSAPEPAIRIRTDRNVPYEAIEPLLREAAQASVSDVRVAVIAESTP